MKICKICGLSKDKSCFSLKKDGKKDRAYHSNVCKPCSAEWARKDRNGERKIFYRIREMKYRDDRRFEVLNHYGNAICKFCGEEDIDKLSIDHTNDNGWNHRKEIGKYATHIYSWLKMNNFPEGFQVLCMSCNHKKARVKKREEFFKRLGFEGASTSRNDVLAKLMGEEMPGPKWSKPSFTWVMR